MYVIYSCLNSDLLIVTAYICIVKTVFNRLRLNILSGNWGNCLCLFKEPYMIHFSVFIRHEEIVLSRCLGLGVRNYYVSRTINFPKSHHAVGWVTGRASGL